MAGRPSCVSHEQVFEVLSKYEIFDSQGNIVVTKNDDIWSKAVTDLKDAITIKNLHTRFYGNRNNLREQLKKQALLNKSEPTKSSKPVEPSSKESEEKSSQAKNDTMEALDKLKTEVCLDAVITDISAKPFHVIYVSPDQIDLYKDFVKLYRTPVYFNVHHNLVENAYIDNNEIKDVLLYCLFGVIDGMIIPFFQTLSERCNKNYLSYSIGEFLRKKVPVPHECVTECSLDLLEGICVALNHQGLEDYCENCFEVLIETKKLEEEKKNCSDEEKQKSIEQQLNKIKSTLPVCVLRIDINYIVQDLRMLVDASIDADKVTLKNYYFDCLLYLCTLTDFEIFDNFVRKLFIVLYKKKFDQVIEQAKNFISESTSVLNFTDLKKNLTKQNVQINSNKNVSDTLSTDFKSNKIYVHFKKMQIEISETVEKKGSISTSTFVQEEAVSTNADLDDNPYRNLNFLTELTKFLTIFPVITKIIRNCELMNSFEYDYLKKKYLSTLNEFTCDKKDKISVDSFICKHIQNLFQQAESCRSMFCKTGSQAIDDKSNSSKELVVYELLDYRENWMGKSGNSEVKEDECKQEQTEKEFEEELLYIKTMLDQSIVSNDHSYCITDHSIEDPSVVDLSVVQAKFSTPKTNKGIYTNPCPNLDLMYSKPDSKSSYKNPVIMNGNTKNPRSKKNRKYKLESTSLFDATVEICVQAMGNYSNFHKFVNAAIRDDKKKESFLSIVHDYALQRDTKKFNTKRFHFLFKNGKVIGDRIFCGDEIQHFLNKIMGDNYGFRIQQICYNCNTTINYLNIYCIDNIRVLKLLKSTETDGTEQTHELFESQIVKTCDTCKQCMTLSYDVENYLAISVKDCDLEICRLKETIDVNCKRFILTGAIETIPTKIAGGQDHFVAYCRFINGNWQVRDNTKTTTSIADIKQKIKIVFLLYVHVE